MFKKVLIINGKKDFGHSKGDLNQAMTDLAKKVLTENGCEVTITNIDNGYDVDTEVEKYLDTDVIIYQMAAWWMGTPWIVKKYMDDVFTIGQGKLYAHDGRVKGDDTKKYGSGGLLHNTKYMVSITWNAPIEVFSDKSQFFEGNGIDSVLYPFHKANQFLDMKPIETFMCNDVMKQPTIEQDMERYTQHLKKYIV